MGTVLSGCWNRPHWLFCFYFVGLDDETDTSGFTLADTAIIVVFSVCFL